MSLSLYRKYRPETFADMIGQDHIGTTLKNAIQTGSVSHAYMFCGPRGTGKTTTARLLAKAMLCDQAPTDHPDGTCLACRQIADGIHPDVYELDAASRTGVENVREEIIGRVQFAPTRGAYKFYIIDEVHMLSTAAFNALLKTLEEPPPHVKFILCTTDPHKVPATIQSRCQRFDFHRLSEPQITQRLLHICEKEGYTAEPSALALISQRSQGGMRDAINSLEQIAVFAGGTVTFEAAESLLGEVSMEQLFSVSALIAERNVADCFAWVAGFSQSGTDIAQFVRDLSVHLRNLYIAAVLANDRRLADLLEGDKTLRERYLEQARLFGSPDRLAYALVVLGDLSMQLRSATDARLALEIALTRLARPDSELTLESLAARIAVLEAGISQPALGEARALGTEAASTRHVLPTVSEESAASATTEVPATTEEAATPAVPAESEVSAEPEAPATPTVPAEPEVFATPEVPATLAEAAATAGPSELTVDSARRLLMQVEKELTKSKRLSVATFLEGASAYPDPKTSGLCIELPSTASFAKQNLEREENIKLIASLIEKVQGAPLALTYVLEGSKAKPIKPASKDLFDKESETLPTEAPTAAPTEAPTAAPTEAPTAAPTEVPTEALIEALIEAPTAALTAEPSTKEGPPSSTENSLSFEEMLSASFGATISVDEMSADEAPGE